MLLLYHRTTSTTSLLQDYFTTSLLQTNTAHMGHLCVVQIDLLVLALIVRVAVSRRKGCSCSQQHSPGVYTHFNSSLYNTCICGMCKMQGSNTLHSTCTIHVLLMFILTITIYNLQLASYNSLKFLLQLLMYWDGYGAVLSLPPCMCTLQTSAHPYILLIFQKSFLYLYIKYYMESSNSLQQLQEKNLFSFSFKLFWGAWDMDLKHQKRTRELE